LLQTKVERDETKKHRDKERDLKSRKEHELHVKRASYNQVVHTKSKLEKELQSIVVKDFSSETEQLRIESNTLKGRVSQLAETTALLEKNLHEKAEKEKENKNRELRVSNRHKIVENIKSKKSND